MSYGAVSAVLKYEIEARLASRIPGALSPVPQEAPRLVPTGVHAVDRLLGGGLPLGGISEVAGVAGSGRTALAFSVLAEATPEAACAYVDAGDCLNPVSAAAAGIRMENLLWVRLKSRAALPRPISIRHAEPTGKALESMPVLKAAARCAKQEGTPGHPNRLLGLVTVPAEQAAYARLFKKDNCASEPREQFSVEPEQILARPHAEPENPWSLLDQAIRAADQVLQSGGFRVVVLDLASTAPEHARRIPAATWFRFRRAAQAGSAVLLLLTRQPCSGSSAACVLDCSLEAASVENGILRAASHAVEIARQRSAGSGARKAPGRVAKWSAAPYWVGR